MLKTPEGNKIDAINYAREKARRDKESKEKRLEYLYQDINRLVSEEISKGNNSAVLPVNLYTRISILNAFSTLESYGYTIVLHREKEKVLGIFPVHNDYYVISWSM